MVPEKPWSRKLGPLGYILLGVFLFPSLAAVAYFLILPKFEAAKISQESTNDSVFSEVEPGEDKIEPTGAFTFVEYKPTDTQRSNVVGFKIIDVKKDAMAAESIREMFSFFPTTSGFLAAVSPDGTRVAYRTPTELRIMRANGTNDMLVAALTESGQIAWSSNNLVLAYQQFTPVDATQPLGPRVSTISIFDTEDNTTTLTHLELSVIHHILGVTNDHVFVRRQIYQTEDLGKIGYYSFMSQNQLDPIFSELLSLDENILSYRFDETGEFLFYVQSTATMHTEKPYRIQRVDVDTGETKTVLETDKPVFGIYGSETQLLFTTNDGLYALDLSTDSEPLLIADRSVLIDETSPTDKLYPIQPSPNKEYLAVARKKDIDPAAVTGGQVLTILFVPLKGAYSLSDVLTLPNTGLLPTQISDNIGWAWIGL